MDATDTTDEAKRDEAMRATGTDPETGFAHDGEWPLNNRLRAEAMAEAGVTTDPQGFVSDELIAATKTRIAAEKAEADAQAKAIPSMAWSKADLAEHAEAAGVTVDNDATKATILDAINAAPAAPSA